MRFGFYTSLTLGSIMAVGIKIAAADDNGATNTPPSMLTQSWDFSDYDHDSLAQIDADYRKETTNLLAQLGSESESSSGSASESKSGSESNSESHSESQSESRSESGSDSDS